MALTVRLRSASPADSLVLTALEQEAFPDPTWTAADFLGYDCTVAEVETAAGTFVVAGFLVSRQTHKGDSSTPPEREILNLAVGIEFRRSGIASRLLKNELARRTTLFLEVRASNTAAIQLYRNAGFIEISRRTDYYDSPVESAIVMRMKW